MVMGLLAKLLLTKQLTFGDGVISLKDIHMTLIPAFFVGELTDYFIKENKLPKFYMLAWFWGFVLVKQVKDKFGLKTPQEVYSLGMDLGEAMGIGLYKTHDYYPGRYTHFVITNNPYLKYFPQKIQKQPIDYFIAGCMGGGGCLVHDAVCQNIEVKCKFAGQEQCEFLTGTEKELKDRKLWDQVVSRYNLKKLYPLQKEIYNNYSEDNESEILEKIMSTIEH